MESVVAVELMMPSGVPHHIVTFGRIQDPVDPAPLEALVLANASTFGLADAISVRVCTSLHEARAAPYFFEALIEFGAAMAAAALEPDRERWRATIDAEMRAGRHLYHLGDPEAPWFRPTP